jgi:hypothetical protein
MHQNKVYGIRFLNQIPDRQVLRVPTELLSFLTLREAFGLQMGEYTGFKAALQDTSLSLLPGTVCYALPTSSALADHSLVHNVPRGFSLSRDLVRRLVAARWSLSIPPSRSRPK